MMRLILDGALDGYALPDGSWTARYPASAKLPIGYISTSAGRIELPGEDVIFLVSTIYSGQFCLAGQGQGSGIGWLYRNGQWTNTGLTFGVSPCAFGEGVLCVVRAGDRYDVIALDTGLASSRAMQIGTQGIRWVDGHTPVSGDSTYRKGDLYEYTTRGDVTVGQGQNGGCIINGGLLEPGDARRVRFERSGDALAVALTQLQNRRVIFRWLMVPEIAALPLPETPPIVPPQPPQPPQPPKPPEPIMQGITDAQFATLQSERAKYPTNRALTREEIGAILNATAWTHRNDPGAKLGMQWKDPNTTVAIMPDAKRTPIWNGLRIIDKDGNHWGEDVCGGCSVGQFNPVRATPGTATASSFIAPVEPSGVIDPPKPPDTPPPSTDVDALKAELAVLRGDLHKLDERLMRQAEDVIAVRDRVLKLEQKPPVGGLPKLKIVVDPAAESISTSRAYGHNHTLRLAVIPEE